MLQLTYISTATAGVAEQSVSEILAASRANNAKAGVTGLLLYDGKRFLQALEGPADEVNAIYERVRRDPRHRAVVMLSSREVDDRAFGDWAMAGQRVAAGQGQSLPEMVDGLTAEVADRNTQALFRGFARVRAAA